MSILKVQKIRHTASNTDVFDIASDGTCTANISSVSGGQIGGRNMIVNGSMQCNQRGNATGLSSSAYVLDRFKLGVSNLGTYSVSQLEGSDELINTGQRNSMKVDCTTADASPAAADLVFIQTRLEGLVTNRLCWGTSNAKKAVLSFWAKADINGWSSGTKDFVVEIQASDSQEFSVVCQLTTAGTWQKFTVPIDAKTSGAIAYDNTESMAINWWLDAGSDWKGGTGVTGWAAKGTGGVRAAGQTLALGAHTDNNFYLTGVQFELNDTGVASDFEHRSYAQELALSQRYYYKLSAGGGGSLIHTNSLQYYAGNEFFGCVLNLPVVMRTKPTAGLDGTAHPWTANGSYNGSFTSLSLNRNSVQSLGTNGTQTSGNSGSAGNATVITLSGDAFLYADAEL